MKTVRLLLVLLGLTMSLSGWTGTDGTYVMDGGSYSVEVEFGEGRITVVEPNKRSEYLRHGTSNEYLFTNPVNGITYGLRVIDDATLQAFKPVPGNVPTTLKLWGQIVDVPDAVAEEAEAVADRYFALSESDPANVQTWTQCAAAALARTVQTAEEADQTARQAAMLLKMMSVDTASSPCPDAISDAIWRAAPAG